MPFVVHIACMHCIFKLNPILGNIQSSSLQEHLFVQSMAFTVFWHKREQYYSRAKHKFLFFCPDTRWSFHIYWPKITDCFNILMKTYELDSQFHLAELTVNKLAQNRKLSPKIYSLKQSFVNTKTMGKWFWG